MVVFTLERQSWELLSLYGSVPQQSQAAQRAWAIVKHSLSVQVGRRKKLGSDVSGGRNSRSNGRQWPQEQGRRT